MHKLPVFATLSNAVGFVFGNFFTVIRLIWLPLALLFLAGFVLPLLIGFPFVEIEVLDEERNPLVVLKRLAGLWDKFAFVVVLQIVLQVMAMTSIAVAVHRVVLFGDTKPGEYFAFAFGWTEILFAVMGALSVLGVLAVVSVFLVPAAAIVVGANPDLRAIVENLPNLPASVEDIRVNPVTMAPMVLAYGAAIVVIVYCALRLFVWPPTIVATGRLSLGAAWRATRGNVARIIGLLALTVAVLWFCMLVLAATLGVVAIGVIVAFGLPEMRDVTMHGQTLREIMRQHGPQGLAPFLPLLFVIELVVAGLATAFTIALISYSYKALNGYDAKAPIA